MWKFEHYHTTVLGIAVPVAGCYLFTIRRRAKNGLCESSHALLHITIIISPASFLSASKNWTVWKEPNGSCLLKHEMMEKIIQSSTTLVGVQFNGLLLALLRLHFSYKSYHLGYITLSSKVKNHYFDWQILLISTLVWFVRRYIFEAGLNPSVSLMGVSLPTHLSCLHLSW